MTVPMLQPVQGDIMENVLIKGDLGKLSPAERAEYYTSVCKSVGLNPLTKPFDYITLNGKLTLYALRGCADQLRKINGVSLEIVSRDVADDVLTVHVRARTPEGRVDEDLGSVSFPATLKGEARANAELKAVTKAKRRATLSICGLGWLDETEVEDIPAAAKRPKPPAPNVMISQPEETTVTPVRGEAPAVEVLYPAPTAAGAHCNWCGGDHGGGPENCAKMASFEAMARQAAMAGEKTFMKFYDERTNAEKMKLRAMKDELVALYPDKRVE